MAAEDILHGKDSTFDLGDGAAGFDTIRNADGYDLNFDKDGTEVTVQGSGGTREYIDGLKGADGSVSLKCSNDELLLIDAAYQRNNNTQLRFRLSGVGTGKLQYVVNARGFKYSISSQIEDEVTLTIDFVVSGAYLLTTQA